MKQAISQKIGITTVPSPIRLLPFWFKGNGTTYECGHFTAEAVVINGNSESFNKNPSFSVYHIMDYTQQNPPGDGKQTNGTGAKSMSSAYVILSGEEALLIDMGNDPLTTAKNFDEDYENEEVIKNLTAQYRQLILHLIGSRKLTIAISHLHYDHIGYSAAFENQGITLLFPAGDVNAQIIDHFKGYHFKPFTPCETRISVGQIALDTLLCPGHTNGSTLFTINTPLITYNQHATSYTATYLTFCGDAIGSGSSVWFFSLDGLKTLNHHIGPVVKKLESYTFFDASLGLGREKGAHLLFLGGHAWQYTNRFGTMNMNIEYIKTMENLLHILADSSKWRYDGDEGLTLEQWLKQGYVVLKPATNSDLYTAYFGTTLTSCAAITCTLPIMKEYAGLTS